MIVVLKGFFYEFDIGNFVSRQIQSIYQLSSQIGARSVGHSLSTF